MGEPKIKVELTQKQLNFLGELVEDAIEHLEASIKRYRGLKHCRTLVASAYQELELAREIIEIFEEAE